jgi:hypothetical protein
MIRIGLREWSGRAPLSSRVNQAQIIAEGKRREEVVPDVVVPGHSNHSRRPSRESAVQALQRVLAVVAVHDGPQATVVSRHLCASLVDFGVFSRGRRLGELEQVEFTRATLWDLTALYDALPVS